MTDTFSLLNPFEARRDALHAKIAALRGKAHMPEHEDVFESCDRHSLFLQEAESERVLDMVESVIDALEWAIE